MAVTAFGDVLLGHIADVAPDSSRVKLVSYPGRETNVYIQGQDFSPGLSAIGVGLGGENMEITLPGDIEIAEGRNITTFDTSPLLLGAVEKIVRKPADPFQKIIFHLSINIQELNHVYIIK